MYLGKEMYDLIPCAQLPHGVTSYTGQTGHDKSLKCCDILIKYVD